MEDTLHEKTHEDIVAIAKKIISEHLDTEDDDVISDMFTYDEENYMVCLKDQYESEILCVAIPRSWDESFLKTALVGMMELMTELM